MFVILCVYLIPLWAGIVTLLLVGCWSFNEPNLSTPLYNQTLLKERIFE